MQILPRREGIPPAPGKSSGTQAARQRMRSFPAASLPMKGRHPSSPKPATDASAPPGCTCCLPGTMHDTWVTPGFVPLLHIPEGRRHGPKFSGDLEPL